jgi:hypothetical protein
MPIWAGCWFKRRPRDKLDLEPILFAMLLDCILSTLAVLAADVRHTRLFNTTLCWSDISSNGFDASLIG